MVIQLGSGPNLTRAQLCRMLVAASALPLIGRARASAAAPVKVGFIIPDYQEMRWRNADQRFFSEAARKLGLKIYVQSSNNSEQQQTNQVENMLTLGVQVLVLTPVNAGAGTALVARARAAGVSVIDYNFLIPNADCAAFIGRDAVEIGAAVAAAAIAARPHGNYVLCLGDEGMSVATETAKGNLNVLQPHVASGAIRIVSQQYNKAWSTALARTQVENALTQSANKVEAVLCSNDEMAYGAIQALQAQGLAGKVFVTGVDCEPQAQKLIQQGLMSLSNFSAFDDMGQAAAMAASKIVSGQKLNAPAMISNGRHMIPWIKVPNVNVTTANLADTVAHHPWLSGSG